MTAPPRRSRWMPQNLPTAGLRCPCGHRTSIHRAPQRLEGSQLGEDTGKRGGRCCEEHVERVKFGTLPNQLRHDCHAMETVGQYNCRAALLHGAHGEGLESPTVIVTPLKERAGFCLETPA